MKNILLFILLISVLNAFNAKNNYECKSSSSIASEIENFKEIINTKLHKFTFNIKLKLKDKYMLIGNTKLPLLSLGAYGSQFYAEVTNEGNIFMWTFFPQEKVLTIQKSYTMGPNVGIIHLHHRLKCK